MGAGSSKKVHPEAAFRAADTDKDGKLTPQELGAMLWAKGFAWSPKRIEGLLCAFDEDGDGALDLAEFAKGLEQLASVAGVVLEEQQPSQPAVAAGEVAVGSRLDKNNYVEEMAAWARDPQQLLPKAVLLQANMAAVQAIGPAYLQAHLEQQQIDELTKALEALKDADIGQRTRAEYQLAEAKKRKAKADAKLAEALTCIKAVMLASAEAISPGLARWRKVHGGDQPAGGRRAGRAGGGERRGGGDGECRRAHRHEASERQAASTQQLTAHSAADAHDSRGLAHGGGSRADRRRAAAAAPHPTIGLATSHPKKC